MAKGKKTGTAPGKKPERNSGFDSPWDMKKRYGGSAIGQAGRAASHAASESFSPIPAKTSKTGSGIKPRGAGRTPKNKGGSGGNPGKK